MCVLVKVATSGQSPETHPQRRDRLSMSGPGPVPTLQDHLNRFIWCRYTPYFISCPVPTLPFFVEKCVSSRSLTLRRTHTLPGPARPDRRLSQLSWVTSAADACAVPQNRELKVICTTASRRAARTYERLGWSDFS